MNGRRGDGRGLLGRLLVLLPGPLALAREALPLTLLLGFEPLLQQGLLARLGLFARFPLCLFAFPQPGLDLRLLALGDEGVLFEQSGQ